MKNSYIEWQRASLAHIATPLFGFSDRKHSDWVAWRFLSLRSRRSAPLARIETHGTTLRAGVAHTQSTNPTAGLGNTAI
ncbi:hypothetical protein NXS19_009847 [Fusarium pseudograminearum]|nr:hypothetical protein NXS19_009847 [Fusarium pseudograminearum]